MSYWISKQDSGQADALSKGFAKATGSIFCWINSDDILLPGAIAHVVEYFRTHPQTLVVSGGGLQVTEDDTPFQCLCNYTLGTAASYNRLNFAGQRNLFQPSTFWRSEVYRKAGGINPDLQFIMDLDLFARMAKYGRFGRLPKLLAAFRVHCDSKSARLQHVQEDELRWFHATYRHDLCFPQFEKVAFCYYRLLVTVEKAALFARKPWIMRESKKLLEDLRQCYDQTSTAV
jgi:GT2 family glycosyltransferase